MSAAIQAMVDLEQLGAAEPCQGRDPGANTVGRLLQRRIAVVVCSVIGAFALVAGVVVFTPASPEWGMPAEVQKSRALQGASSPYPEFSITDVLVDGSTFTYQPVGYVGDTLVSMILEPAPGKDFYPGEGSQSGKTRQNMGLLNCDSGKLSGLKVSFVRNGTRDAVIIPRLAFTIHDIDSSHKRPENVTVYGTSGFDKTGGSYQYFRTTESMDGTVSVESIHFGNSVGNPNNVDYLTEAQLDRSITLYFEGVSDFFMDVDLTGVDGRGARNLMFSLKQFVNRDPPPNCDVEVHEFKIRDASVSEDRVITYSGIGEVNGEDVDFVIQAAKAGSWHTHWPKKSGVHFDGLGRIMALVGRNSAFRASFFKSGTATPINVPNFAFTIYDIDSGWDGPERYEISGLTSFSTQDPQFFVEQQQNTLVAVSLVQDLGGVNNPDPDSTNFTEEQVQLSMTANFENTSSFNFEFDMSGMGMRDKHRMMYFTLLHTVETCATVVTGDSTA